MNFLNFSLLENFLQCLFYFSWDLMLVAAGKLQSLLLLHRVNLRNRTKMKIVRSMACCCLESTLSEKKLYAAVLFLKEMLIILYLVSPGVLSWVYQNKILFCHRMVMRLTDSGLSVQQDLIPCSWRLLFFLMGKYFS